jgi:hypothetical protein
MEHRGRRGYDEPEELQRRQRAEDEDYETPRHRRSRSEDEQAHVEDKEPEESEREEDDALYERGSRTGHRGRSSAEERSGRGAARSEPQDICPECGRPRPGETRERLIRGTVENRRSERRESAARDAEDRRHIARKGGEASGRNR